MPRIPVVLVSCVLFHIVHPAFCIGAITVVNGDAETGDLTGWTASGAASAATSLRHSGGTATPDQGDWFFSFARPASRTGELEQTGTMEVGSGPVLRLSGIFQIESGTGDAAEAVLTLLDDDSALVAEQTTGRLIASNRWRTFSVDVAVPPTATSWRINLLGTRGSVGQHIDSFVDDIRLGILGDFNQDGELSLHDLETLISAIQATNARKPRLDLDRLQFDLDRSEDVDASDLQHWIKELSNTWIGDANLDGEFDSGDLIGALAAGTYEADKEAVWSSGDFDGTGRFNSADLISALADGGYEQGPRAATAAVPEPSAAVLLLIGLTGVLGFRNRK